TPLIPGEKRTIALKWDVYDPRSSGYPLLAMDRASDWASFRAALSTWWAPTQNVVYADDQGHIGYQAVGYIPLRPGGLAGVPITDEQHEWHGYIAFDYLPSAFDPPDGLLATANARVTPNPNPPTAPVAGAPVANTPTPEPASPNAGSGTPNPDAGSSQSPSSGSELTLEWGDPYRNERIWKWLSPKDHLTQEQMLTLQTD